MKNKKNKYFALSPQSVPKYSIGYFIFSRECSSSAIVLFQRNIHKCFKSSTVVRHQIREKEKNKKNKYFSFFAKHDLTTVENILFFLWSVFSSVLLFSGKYINVLNPIRYVGVKSEKKRK